MRRVPISGPQKHAYSFQVYSRVTIHGVHENNRQFLLNQRIHILSKQEETIGSDFLFRGFCCCCCWSLGIALRAKMLQISAWLLHPKW